jgi:hypothetical protein
LFWVWASYAFYDADDMIDLMRHGLKMFCDYGDRVDWYHVGSRLNVLEWWHLCHWREQSRSLFCDIGSFCLNICSYYDLYDSIHTVILNRRSLARIAIN